ncbi:MAG TPA: glycosyltransferase family 1 protein [Gemmatimonas sp.]|nr:glycosyltransferase family 1 protein [Gemmatimonas sp.]
MTETASRVQHVGVEATRLLREKRGIGRYVRNVLLQLSLQRPDLRFTLYVWRARDLEPLRQQMVDLAPALAERCTVAPVSELSGSSADIVWYPWNRINPRARRATMVATIQDLAPMLEFGGRWWKVWKRFKQRHRYQDTADHATLILTISTFTASEVRRLLRVDASKLRVTLLAADDCRIAAGAQSETLARLGIDGPFFLTVGAHDARKNLSVLYRAMALLHARGENVPLVQCGPGVKPDSDGKVAPWLRAAGYVSDGELATLYRKATALVFPSRYEGFGLPVSEAMLAGGCVICASESSLPEVGGEAALYFPWNDAEALAAQMSRLLHEPGLRDRHMALGPQHAAKFSWAKCASETLAVFDEAHAIGTARVAGATAGNGTRTYSAQPARGA